MDFSDLVPEHLNPEYIPRSPLGVKFGPPTRKEFYDESSDVDENEPLMQWENKKNLPMYPVLPESWKDLGPLPPVAGPKIQPFDFGDDDSIEFLEVIADANKCCTSIVMKVKIGARIYALKLFKFFSPSLLGPHGIDWGDCHNRKYEDFYYWLWCDDPFGAECRVYGRLKEAGREDLAAKCYGYLLLKKEYEILLEQKFGLIPSTWDGMDTLYERAKIGRAFAQKDGQYRPIRGIVKELLVGSDKFEPANRNGMLRDILGLHELGIIHGDVKADAWVGSRLCDFSQSTTSPHGAINPEFTNNPKVNWSAFQLARSDLFDFDKMVDKWNEEVGEPQGKKIWKRVTKNRHRYGRQGWGSSLPYLRRNPGNYRTSPGSIPVDPRTYDWRAGKTIKKRRWIWRETKDNPEDCGKRHTKLISFPKE